MPGLLILLLSSAVISAPLVASFRTQGHRTFLDCRQTRAPVTFMAKGKRSKASRLLTTPPEPEASEGQDVEADVDEDDVPKLVVMDLDSNLW